MPSYLVRIITGALPLEGESWAKRPVQTVVEAADGAEAREKASVLLNAPLHDLDVDLFIRGAQPESN